MLCRHSNLPKYLKTNISHYFTVFAIFGVCEKQEYGLYLIEYLFVVFISHLPRKGNEVCYKKCLWHLSGEREKEKVESKIIDFLGR
jgi:hypothetical protein